MADTSVHPPFEAYRGDAPFIFVSYAHADAPAVFPELVRLRESGYRIWYDEGIDPGNEWPEAIEQALQRCAFFLVFMTDRAVASRNVRNEINFALCEAKPFVAIHIEETDLRYGLKLSMSSVQAIFKYRTRNDGYWRVLTRALPEAVREAIRKEPPRPESPESGRVAEKHVEAEDTAAAPARTEPESPASRMPISTSESTPATASTLDAGAPRTVDLGNGVNLDLVWIPPGEFLMGSPDSDRMAKDDEKPQHRVEITRGFWLGKYPVTKRQWQAVMGTEPWAGKQFVLDEPESPAVYVGWDDTQAFCHKVGTGARLPTEAEWECACRAGTTTAYSFGDNAAQLGDYAWYRKNTQDIGNRYAHEIGQKRANAWGLNDMHGNVWEWCQDWYDYYPSGNVTNPTGPSSSGSKRVKRGGSWNNYPRFCRSANRNYFTPGCRYDFLGFRLAFSPVW